VLLNKSIIFILLKQLTHTITVWNCGNVQSHIIMDVGSEDEGLDFLSLAVMILS
jgi:hypothetical protein